MTGERRRRLTVLAAAGLAIVLVALGAVAGVRWWRDFHRTDLERALAYAPASSERFAWTDWAAVRDQLGSDIGGGSTGLEVTELLNAAYDADLASTTAMAESADVLQERFGFSPATVSWELLSQSTEGAVLTLGLPDSADFGDLADALGELGYDEPDSASGVWVGGDQLLAELAAGGSVSPQFAHLALDAERHLVLASDTESYLESAVAAVADDGGGVDVDEAARGLDDPVSAVLLDAAQACGALAMSQADPVDQATAADLLAAAGDVDPLTSYGIGARADGVIRVAMSLETEDQARTNADTRAELASGPAPGQGGDFADRFTLGEVVADGTLVTMDLEPVEGAFVLSDLSSGPVLFATC